ncbi:MAG: hypothetical protein IJD17_03620 [Clostridia bacterium]|nr:hypothetical protein [Clostridia bacterium]
MDKQFLKNAARYIVSAAVSILVIIYIVYHLINSFSEPLETSPAQLVTVNETISVEAYILRDEIVLQSSTGGGINCLYPDGTMVRRDCAVADVYSGSDTESIKSSIAKIDDQIKILEDSAILESSIMSDSSVIDAELSDLYYTVQSKINENNLDYVFRRKNEMLTLINKRLIVKKLVSGYTSQIAELQNQRLQLTASLTNISETVYAPSAGYFYSELDGYESTFNAAAADTLTVSDYKSLIETEPTKYGNNVVGKLATDYKWYIACLVDASQAMSFIDSQNYSVIFPYSSDAEIPMTLYRSVPDEESGLTLLIFSTGKVNADFNFLRRQTVEIVAESYTGYRVPVSSVRIVDGKQGVYVLMGNVVKFREITPLVEIDGNLIVKEQDKVNDPEYALKLGFYDAIITKGKNLYEDKIIG